VIELKKDEGGNWVRKELVVTNKLNGISGGVRVGGKVYMGSRMYNGILVCDYNQSQSQYI